MMNRFVAYVQSLFQKSKGKEIVAVDEGNTVEDLDYCLDEDHDEFEAKYQQKYDRFTEIVQGSRYEHFAGKVTALWALEDLLSDDSSGKTRVCAKYTHAPEYSFEIDAHHVSSADFEVLKKVLEIAQEELQDPEEFEGTDFTFEVFKSIDDVTFDQCEHDYISSNNSVIGNKFDSNNDTYGTNLGIMAVRSYLLFNHDTQEFIVADGRYYCV